MSVTKPKTVDPSSPAAISRFELEVQKSPSIAAALWEVLWVRRAWPTVKRVAWITTYPYNLRQPLDEKIWLVIPFIAVVIAGAAESFAFTSMCIAAYITIGIALSAAVPLTKSLFKATALLSQYVHNALFVDIVDEIRKVLDEEISED
jgi:hypothetical protein